MTLWSVAVNNLTELRAINITNYRPSTPVPVVSERDMFLLLDDIGIADDNYEIIKPDSVTTGATRWVRLGTSKTARLDLMQAWDKNQYSQLKPVTSGASITINASIGNNFFLDLAHNTTIMLPTNGVAGMVLILTIRQPATPRIVDWHTDFYFAGGTKPTATAIAGAWDDFLLRCIDANTWGVSAALGFRKIA